MLVEVTSVDHRNAVAELVAVRVRLGLVQVNVPLVGARLRVGGSFGLNTTSPTVVPLYSPAVAIALFRTVSPAPDPLWFML